MMDISTLCIVIIAVVSVITIPVQMVRHLREDFSGKFGAGEKKFDRIVNQLEKVSDNLAKTHADYAGVKAQLDMLIAQRGK